MAKLITNTGNQKLLAATPLAPVTIKSIAIGNGTGAFDAAIMSLKSEVWRGDASAPIRNNDGGLEISAHIPANVGGWNMTEWGWIDKEGDLIAYGQFDNPIFKAVDVMTIETILSVSLDESIEANLIVTDSLNWEHNKMTERNANDAHPITAITGLNDNLIAKDNAISEIHTSISLDREYKKITSNYTVLNDDGGLIEVDASSGNIVITMAKSTSHIAKEISFVRTDASSNTVTLNPASGDKLYTEGADYPLALFRRYELFKAVAGSNYWTGVRSNRTVISTESGKPNIVDSGAILGQVVLMSDKATSSDLGVIQLATNAEALAGTDTTKAITPAGVKAAFDQSLAESGWCKLPNGLIMQWGVSSTQSVTFPKAFEVDCFNIVGSYVGQTYDTSIFAVMSKTATSFETNTSTRQYYWHAIGR